jgi:pectinesterase
MRPFLLALLASVAASAQPAVTVTVQNPTALARPDEVVEVDWAALSDALPGLSADAVRAVSASGAELVSQPLDFDRDGTPEHLLVLMGLWPNETQAFRVEAAAPTEPHTPRVHVRHDDYRDDMAWESDRVAWRTYGKGLWEADEFEPLNSSGIDVWLKRTRDLVTEAWYEKGHDAYHVDTGEGADFYSVGTTLGAGGTGVWADGQLWRAENFDDWRILADGPIRAVFEMDYGPFDAGGRSVTETKRITINAGRHLFRQESTYGAAVPAVVGLVDRPEGVVSSSRRGDAWTWLAMWGPVERKNGGHGELGTAVIVPTADLDSITREGRHDMAVMTAAPGEPVVSYAGAGWTASGDVDSVEAWWAHLDAEVARLSAPVVVTVGE